jgi:hypothetical protein
MTTDDDEYNGWFIPKGTIVIGSAWFVMNNSGAQKLTLAIGLSSVILKPTKILPSLCQSDGSRVAS